MTEEPNIRLEGEYNENEGTRDWEEKGLFNAAIIPPSSISPKLKEGDFIKTSPVPNLITVPSPLISTVPREVADNEKEVNRTDMTRRKKSRDKITFMPLYRSRAPVFCQNIPCSFNSDPIC